MDRVKFDLKYSGDYDKNKVAVKIILATNQYLKDGFKLNSDTWALRWNATEKCFTHDNSYNWASILSSILVYGDYKLDKPLKPKTEIIADLLGVEYSWIQGFLNKLDGRYDSIIKNLSKRKSIKGQQCRDGMEIGNLLRIGYLLDRSIIASTYSACEKEKYESHNWVDIDESIILASMGVIQNNKIFRCDKCQIFGGFVKNFFKPDAGYYVSSTFIDNRYWHRSEPYNFSCDEVIIKNILE